MNTIVTGNTYAGYAAANLNTVNKNANTKNTQASAKSADSHVQTDTEWALRLFQNVAFNAHCRWTFNSSDFDEPMTLIERISFIRNENGGHLGHHNHTGNGALSSSINTSDPLLQQTAQRLGMTQAQTREMTELVVNQFNNAVRGMFEVSSAVQESIHESIFTSMQELLAQFIEANRTV